MLVLRTSNFQRKQAKTHLIQFFISVSLVHVFTEKLSGTSTIHLGIFLGWALWPDSVSPRTNTIVSSDQFKPMRIGENLVVNYKVDHVILLDPFYPAKSLENIGQVKKR